MQRNHLLKYILDIESILSEINQVKALYPSFVEFQSNFLAVRTIERHLEIIGEAINKLQKDCPNIQISEAKQIISLRNYIIHSYDSVDTALLWKIIVKDVPILEDEIRIIRQSI